MKKLLTTIKKMVALGLAAAMLVAPVCGGTTTAYAKSKTTGTVKINKKHFPDAAFRAFVKKEFDKNKDGELSKAEIAKVKEMYPEYANIKSFKGLEYFTNLTLLSCSGNLNKTLDVSRNKKLEVLYCEYNNITNLDVSGNKNLKELVCFDCNLKKLDVSKNTKLQNLHCYGNQLTSLDVSKNTKLQQLLCYKNKLKQLDVSKNVELVALDCRFNQLTSLDVSKNTKLGSLLCNYNNLTTLDVSNCNDLCECGCDEGVKLIGYTKPSEE